MVIGSAKLVRRIQIELPLLDKLHNDRRSEHLRYRADSEERRRGIHRVCAFVCCIDVTVSLGGDDLSVSND
jgi:hypothetical protein